jgi:hypothetical protein
MMVPYNRDAHFSKGEARGLHIFSWFIQDPNSLAMLDMFLIVTRKRPFLEAIFTSGQLSKERKFRERVLTVKYIILYFFFVLCG